MNIIAKMKCQDMHELHDPRWGNPIAVSMDQKEVDHGLGPYGIQTKYILYLTVGCYFLANQAQYQDARKNAEDLLLRELFESTLKYISYARKAIFDQNGEAALNALAMIENEILGK